MSEGATRYSTRKVSIEGSFVGLYELEKGVFSMTTDVR